MSQIHLGSNDPSLDHYKAGADLPQHLRSSHGLQPGEEQKIGMQKQPVEHEPPVELIRARPAPKSSSGWSAGRVAACIFTAGISELLRLAWRGIMACCSSSRPAPAPEPRTKSANANGLPLAAPDADAQNTAVAKAIVGNGSMPPAHQQAVDELLEELRGQFGSKYIPEGKTMAEFIKAIPGDMDLNAARNIYSAVKDAKGAVGPQELQKLLRRLFVPYLKKMILVEMAEAEAQKQGGLGGLKMLHLVMNQLNAKGMAKKVDACTNMEDMQAVFRKMGLAKTIAQIQGGLNDVVRELQGIYGKDALPDDLEGLLKLGDKGGHRTLKSELESLCYKSHDPITAADLKEEAREYLLSSANFNYVSKAVRQAAQQQACPVSERSVSALADAILAVPGNKAAINAAKGPQDLARVVNGMAGNLIAVQKATAEEVYAQYEGQVRPELKPLLRSHIQGLSFAPADAAASRQAVADMADHMKNWKDFAGGDPEMQAVENCYHQFFSEDLKDLDDNGRDHTGYEDNIYNTLIRDANAAGYAVNGTRINPDTGREDLPAKIQTLLPNGQDQRFLSKLINQRMLAQWAALTANGMLPDGRLARDVPGTGCIPVQTGGQTLFVTDLPGSGTMYDVTIAEDKKTATVVAT
ncbi:MAG: hypothetical protein J6P53_04765, partial [Mailhella sp.]|nr:hypothetical protein [Mailhella sp.]